MRWLNRMEYPFEQRFFDADGHRMHYVDEGQGAVILFIHGTPSWSFDFRNVIRVLRSNYRCIAVDHLGFGLSDKNRDIDYSTIAHASRLKAFIENQKLTDITMVVHDFGGPIGLSVAMEQPELFRKFVVLNSWLWSSEDDADFKRMKRILKSPLLPFLYLHLNFSPRFVLPAAFGDRKLSSDLRLQYTAPFASRSERHGALAFTRSLLNDQHWFESLWHKRTRLSDKPFLFIWGMKDPVIRPHMLDKFMQGFPHASVVRIESAGHFPQEEQPEAVAKAIVRFLAY